MFQQDPWGQRAAWSAPASGCSGAALVQPSGLQAEAAGPVSCGELHGLLGAVLDELDHGVLICAPDARLLAFNRCASHALQHHPQLRLKDHTLAVHQGSEQPLLNALKQAALGRRSLVALGEGNAHRYLACTPLGDPQQVLVLMGRDRAYSTLAFEMFCAQHQLTHAERRVLGGLVDGVRPIDMAQAHGVALSTVRTQIAHIRAKLGADRIESLMQMAAGLPPLAALLGPGAH